MQQALTIILTSAVVSSIISILGNLFLKRREFRYSYEKYILEKRQTAYEELFKVINQIKRYGTHIHHENGIKREIKIHAMYMINDSAAVAYTNTPTYTACVSLSEIITNYHGWYSVPMNKILVRIQEKFSDSLKDQFLESPVTKTYVAQQGYASFPILHELFKQTHDQYFKDLKSLSNIRAFQKESRPPGY